MTFDGPDRSVGSVHNADTALVKSVPQFVSELEIPCAASFGPPPQNGSNNRLILPRNSDSLYSTVTLINQQA